jgi:hypothetical protein
MAETTPPATVEGSYDWWRTEVAARDADLERLRAELAEIKRVTDPPEADEEMPTDPAELREMWEFINRQFRWWHHMAQTFYRGRRRAIGRTEQAEAVVERVRDLCHQPYTAAYDLAADVLAELPCRPGNAPESNAPAPSPVSAATEAHGETTEAQEG